MTFQTSGSTTSFSPTIRIENDDVAELNETFSVMLSSSNEGIVVSEESSIAVVHIIDNDSKFTLYVSYIAHQMPIHYELSFIVKYFCE